MTLSALRSHVQADRPLHVRDFGAVGDGTTDDTAAVQAAIDAASALGGGIVQFGPRRYRIGPAGLELRPQVTLQGSRHAGAQRASANYSGARFALLLDPAGGIRVRRNGGISGLALVRQGLATVTTLRQALDQVAAFAGTAIRVGDTAGNTGTDARLERLLILGFDTAIEVVLSQRVAISDIAADCRNGIVLRESYDVTRVRDVHLWPFVTGNLTGISIATFTVAAVANAGGQVRITTAAPHGLLAGDVVHVTDVGGVPGANGSFAVTVPAPDQLHLAGSAFSGAWTGGGRVAVWANRPSGTGFRVESCDAAELRGCFAYGYQTGFRIEGSSMATQLIGCGYDDRADIRDDSTVGLSLGGSCYRTKWVGGYFFSTGTSILADSASTGQNQHHVIGAQISGGHLRAIEMRRGGLVVEGCDFTGGLSGTGRIWLADTAGSLAVLGSDIRPILFEGQSPAALSRLILAGNRLAATGGPAALAGGSIEFQTTDSTSANGLATRVEIANDGGVGLRRRAGGLGARLALRDPSDAEAFAVSVQAGATILQSGSGGSLAERLRIATDGTVTLSGPLVLAGDPTAALQAATRGYVDAQFTERRLARLAVTAATALTHAAHNARLVIVRPGGSLSAAWADTGDGFSCLVLNLSGADLPIALSGFSPNAVQNPDGHAKVRAGGLASLLAVTPDGGTTRLLHLSGAGAP
ncbi:MAG: glycoside hydrolase family 55 protein [Acetobacteraceae bacterium]|nr:glycoside hydrolase family 55 protein [Acetobacteraceae bacterium]